MNVQIFLMVLLVGWGSVVVGFVCWVAVTEIREQRWLNRHDSEDSGVET